MNKARSKNPQPTTEANPDVGAVIERLETRIAAGLRRDAELVALNQRLSEELWPTDRFDPSTHYSAHIKAALEAAYEAGFKAGLTIGYEAGFKGGKS